MDGFFRKKWKELWITGILAISIFLIAITLFENELVNIAQGMQRALLTFLLTWEGTVATWWSGMFLLLIGLHAFDGYVLFRRHQPNLSRAWAYIAIVLLLLSADELGSIHERVGGWLALIPYATVLLAMLSYAIVSMWSAKVQRSTIALILSGFALFGVVALLEFVEHNVHLPMWLARRRGGIEEGTELLGMMLLLIASINNTQGLFARRIRETSPTFAAVCYLRVYILAGGLVLAPVLAYLSVNLYHPGRADIANWFAATTFFFAAIATCRPFFKHGYNIGLLEWMLIFLCCFGSVSAVALVPEWQLDLVFMEVNLRVFAFASTSFIICLIWIASKKYTRRVPLITLAGFAFISLFQTNAFLLYVLTQGMGLTVYYAQSDYDCRLESYAG